MRHRNVLNNILVLGALASLSSMTANAGAQVLQFTAADWLQHRGAATKLGSNGDPGLLGKQVGQTWVYPGTGDLPAEIVVDNTILPVPAPAFPAPVGAVPLTQNFEVTGANWVYPAINNRPGGAWPPSDVDFNKLGDYIYTDGRHSQVLADINNLASLPNIGDPTVYKQINDELATDTHFVRWTFGTAYPYGTFQGTRQISFFTDAVNNHVEPLAANQRYAVYIRYPSSGTIDANGTARPNVDHAMVRVSWGANPDDPATSRIFQVDFSQTGGTWIRIRKGDGDDRYFPYDGTNPIRVTLYSLTPDNTDPANNPQFGAAPIVPADSVRLVPEALRGDIHAPAASALFSLPTQPNAGTRQLTFFGRDETTAPAWTTVLANAVPTTGIQPIGWDPTAPVQNDPNKANYNPLIDDPTASIRTAVFYCIEDDLVNRNYGRLRWRYPARTNPIQTFTVDNADVAATDNFILTGTWAGPLIAPAQQFGTSYWTSTVTADADPANSATWKQSLPQVAAGGTWSVWVWIPGGVAEDPAHFATYQIQTDQGVATYTLDQRNIDPNNPNVLRTGMWRQLAGGVRFGPGNIGGNNFPFVGNVTLLSTSQRDIAEGGAARVVMADAVQFVSEARTSNSVVAAPLLANIKWTSGTERQVVYFATTDGHIWCLDALGAGTPAAPVANTTAYWVYPSISNPATGTFNGLQDDPNYLADAQNKNHGIDGDLAKTTVGGVDVFSPIRAVPTLSEWRSSPTLIRVNTAVAPNPPVYQQYIVLGNMNGRMYAVDAVGRTSGGEPFANTIAVGDTPGVPGTSFRTMTWPSVARDKWLRVTNVISEFDKYSDDPAKGTFSASPAANVASLDPLGLVPTVLQEADRVIVGSGDGHVYAVDMSFPALDPKERISHSTGNNTATDGQPLWLYPNNKTQVDAIGHPGSLSPDGARYVFTAGGRVYSIETTAPAPNNNGAATPALRWVYPDPNTAVAPEPFEFTAPVLRTVNNFNGGNEAVFIANRDGRVFSFNNNVVGGVANAPLWTSGSIGGTRASATMINNLRRQDLYNTRDLEGPRILLPLDNGGLVAFDIFSAVAPNGGGLAWSLFDALIGAVPLSVTDINGNPTLAFFGTSAAYRGADAITANQWVFQGDEGNQDTGEVNGQMRAYGSEDIGLVTPGEPQIRPVTGGVELRMVDLWNGSRDVGAPNPVWDQFGLPMNALSPYDERKQNHQKQNTTGNVVIYEWGDTIYMAAWGMYSGNIVPQVTFTISGATNKQVPAIVTPDTAYGGPALTTTDPVQGNLPARPFVAKAQYSLGRGTDDFPQTPGRQYRVSAFAQMTAGGSFYRTPTIFAGQFDDPAVNPGPPVDPNNTAVIGEPRIIAIAHPFAVTTRGVAATGDPNIVGWTSPIPADFSGVAPSVLAEIMANGNSLSAFQNNAFVPTTLKDLIAPVGLVTHGASAGYATYDGTGKSGAGLLIADRSNLFKNNQRLSGVRVERTDIRWGWDRTGAAYNNDPLRLATGNVMNPLPWETFPNTVPNVSPDYPDVNRDHAAFNVSGQNMATRPITLAPPNIAGNVKTLIPTTVDLVVDVPKYQPANVNTYYFDINGTRAQVVAPMNMTTGTPGVPGIAAAPSAGYVGAYAVYVDVNNDGVFQGFAPGVTQGQRVVLQAREEVFRQLNVGLAVPPDVNLRTEEETIDIGTVAHSMGYTPDPTKLFQPSYLGIYQNTQSIWDSPAGYQFFKPFTVRNQGNVNLVNVRAAKYRGPYGISAPNTQPPLASWFYLTSDQVEPFYTFNNPPLAAPRYAPFGANSPGNLGVVTSLDHLAGGWPYTLPWDNDLWPFAANGVTVPLPTDYVLNGNVLGWAPNTRRRPTIGKPRPGDSSARTMSIPDVYYGDPLNVVNQLAAARGTQDSVRPKISVAIPLGTPAGTYTMPVYIFEDHIPEQWRAWLYGTPDQLASTPGDDDGVMNTVVTGAGSANLIPEGRSNPFALKVTVAEARLTNGSSPGSYIQIDNRGNLPSLGANIQPVATRDVKTGNIVLFWPSNRQQNGNVWTDPGTPDAPWYLFYTQLNSAATPAQSLAIPYFDWRYELGGATQWWNPLGAAQQYPAPGIAQGLFPSQTSDILAGAPPATPLVPGTLNALSIRHATPALTQDEDLNGPMWLFWQGAASKSGATGGAFANDTRTFYVPVVQNGNTLAPDPATPPLSFLNDPGLPKYAPKPLVITAGGTKVGFLFWYGGEQGRSKLYYNSNRQMPDVTRWSADTLLQTPGTLQYQSEPAPIHRRVFTTWFNPQGELLDCIDVIYTGVLPHRREPETMLTRYALEYQRDAAGVITNNTPTGRLVPIPVGVQEAVANGQTVTPQTTWGYGVVDELMSRQGNSAVWASRDVAWVYSANRWDAANNRFRRDLLRPNAGNGEPYFQLIMENRAGVRTPLLVTNFNDPPELDNATGKMYVKSALGGRIIIDPQAGTITFNGPSPTNADKVLVSYSPMTLRLNVSRNQTGEYAPAGTSVRSHVEPSAPATQPVAFLDRTPNPRQTAGNDNTVFLPQAGPPMEVTRLWLFFRKTGGSTAAPSTIWYKTMRLMVRLPQGVVREPDGRVLPNITVANNQGPYEVDWIRGRVYFTELDEGRPVTITFAYARDSSGNKSVTPPTTYRVTWGDEISSAVSPGDATTNERVLPLSTPVNEGQVSAFKDPFQDKVWVFWSSTRSGTTDLYYMTLNPQFYTQPGF